MKLSTLFQPWLSRSAAPLPEPGTGDLLPAPETRRAPRPLYGPDRVGLVGFNARGFIIARPASPFAPQLIQRNQTLDQRLAGGSNISDGLQQALDLILQGHPGARRRIWLLSDGYSNRDNHTLMDIADDCGQADVAINAVGIGNHPHPVLEDIAACTRSGRFMPFQALADLSLTLADTPHTAPRRHRSETTVLVVDCSRSMWRTAGIQANIHTAQDAVLHLLHFKQRLFA